MNSISMKDKVTGQPEELVLNLDKDDNSKSKQIHKQNQNK